MPSHEGPIRGWAFRLPGVLVVAPLVLWACGDAQEEAARPAPADSVVVVFTRDEAPAPVGRPVTGPSPEVRTALVWLLRGPTSEERAAGMHSWFSEATADALRSVEVASTGRATIDFRDLRQLIPNASSSAGSTMLLQELNGTVFQFPEIQSVEYRIDGSCDAFWEWLQYACRIVTRPQR